jgi:hypothetical protein
MRATVTPLKLLAATLLLLALAGCAGYQADPEREPVSLALGPVVNESDLPQLTAPLARNLREAIAHAPGYRLDGAQSAGARLHVTVTGRTRQAVARDPEDTGRPLSYFQTLQLQLRWEGPQSPPWGPDPVSTVDVETLLYAQPSLVQTERAALNEWSERAAREVLARLHRPAAP